MGASAVRDTRRGGGKGRCLASRSSLHARLVAAASPRSCALARELRRSARQRPFPPRTPVARRTLTPARGSPRRAARERGTPARVCVLARAHAGCGVPAPPPRDSRPRHAALRHPSASRSRRARREGAPLRRPPQLPRAPAAAGGRRSYESRVERGPGAAAAPLPANPAATELESFHARGVLVEQVHAAPAGHDREEEVDGARRVGDRRVRVDHHPHQRHREIGVVS